MTFDEFAKQNRLQIQSDREDATAIIRGRKGQSRLFEYGEGLIGVAVMPNARTAHCWNAARGAFAKSGMEIRQDGDQEGTATFDPEYREQVRVALKYAGVKRKRKVSEQERRRLTEMGFKKPPAPVPRVPQNEFVSTVQGEKTTCKRRARHG
jgi:hypothetical protein